MPMMYFPQYAKGRDGIELRAGESILEHIRRIGDVEIDSECGGKGLCGKDVVKVYRGVNNLKPMTESEKSFMRIGKINSDQRLACQAIVAEDDDDICVFISSFGKYSILSDIANTEVRLSPSVYKNGDAVFPTFRTSEPRFLPPGVWFA